MKTKLVTLGIAVSIIAAIGGIATLATTVQAQGIDSGNPICDRNSPANQAEDVTDSNNGNGNVINHCGHQ